MIDLSEAIKAEAAKAARAVENLEDRNERAGIHPGWLAVDDPDYLRHLRATSRHHGAVMAAGMLPMLDLARLRAAIAEAKAAVVTATDTYRRLKAEYDAWQDAEEPEGEEPDWGYVCDARDGIEDAHDRVAALTLLRRLSKSQGEARNG